jgi:hypothetical protein
MGDEDSVDQVKMEDDGVKLGGGQTRVNIGVWWFRPQNHRCGFGGLGLKIISGGFTSLGLKTRVEVSRRNGRHVAALGSSRRGEATGEEAR